MNRDIQRERERDNMDSFPFFFKKSKAACGAIPRENGDILTAVEEREIEINNLPYLVEEST